MSTIHSDTSAATRAVSVLLMAALLLTSTGYPLLTHADDDATDSMTASSTAPAAVDSSATTDDVVSTSTAPTPAILPISDVASSTDESITSIVATSTAAGDITSIASSTAATATTSISEVASSTSEDTSATSTATSTDTSDATTTTPTIESGTSVALANILNIINTNFVNATGATLLLNYTAPTGSIDLRDASSTLTSGAVCQTYLCAGDQGATVNLASTGSIANAVVLNATTGGNTIHDPGAATSTIDTGNAYAGLNLINLENTNVVNSNYLLVTLNAFQGVNGNIVFPSLTNFLNSLTSTLASPSDISISGDASVSNDITTSADSGDNTVASSSDSSISSGDSASTGNVFNQLNTSIDGGTNVSLLFRVQGNWAGQVYGAPAGLTWTQDPNGNVYLFTDDSSSTPATATDGSVAASSNGSIANDVQVTALTGQNAISNAASAVITTGTAEAAANVVNIANTNIVGKNWILAIINIFGNFNGNVDFGLPDLFAGIQASAPTNLVDGSSVNYTLTVINNGDAPADNATLTDTYDAQHIAISNPSVPYTMNAAGDIVWDLGTLPPGDAEQITYTGIVQNAEFNTPIQTNITANETETDNNPTDNSDSVTVTTEMQPEGSYGSAIYTAPTQLTSASLDGGDSAAAAADLTITRTTATSTPDAVTHLAHESLDVYNPDAATSTPVILHDTLRGPSGAIIADQAWNLSEVRPHEHVEISYDAKFDPAAIPGTYTLTAELIGANGAVTGKENSGVILVSSSLAPESTSYSKDTSSVSEKTSTSTTLIASNSNIFSTPKAMASSNLLAAVDSGPAQSLWFWLSILLALLALMGMGAAVNQYVSKRK